MTDKDVVLLLFRKRLEKLSLLQISALTTFILAMHPELCDE